MQKLVPFLVTLFSVIAAGAVLNGWLSRETVRLGVRAAEEAGSQAEARAEAAERDTDLAGCFRRFPEVTRGTFEGQWPGFRGPGRDNVARGAGALLDAWPEGGPEVLWSAAVGDGHAMPAVSGGCLYLLDYDEARGGDMLVCLNADTGAMLWEHLYAVKTKRNHGISRTVAATDGDAVVTIGPQCHTLCLAAADGAYRWGIDMAARYGTKVPLWYTGQCPLVEGGMAVLAPAGTNVLMCGIDVKTGETVFETPNTLALGMSHSSVMSMMFDGVRQYVYAGLGGIVGVAAEGEGRGAVLWHTALFAPSVVAPSPVALGDGRFVMVAGYGFGGAMFRVSRDASGAWQVEGLLRMDKRHFACEQQSPIFLDGLLYTVLPSDGGGDRQQLVCMTPEGERLWASGKDDLFGLGPFVAAEGGRMFLLNDAGTLTLARVGRDGYQRLARHALMDGRGRDAWGPMVLAAGRLYLRDSTRLYCLNVGK
jgi:outer membrane protein assembly factor BamB